jgi:hypothetical protein
MATKITRYSPDTCSCVIEYSWDDTLSETNRVHTLSTYVNKCSAHTSLNNTQAWNAVFEENPRKNLSLGECLANGPSALFDTIDGTRQLKNGISFNWSWSGTAPDRVLTISFTGISLTTNQKNTIQTFLNNKFGANKVIIV